MKSKIEKAGPCRKVLAVSASATEVVPEHKEIVKLYMDAAKIKGFRQGKAPESIVTKHYAKEIEEETKDRMIHKLYRDALKEEKIIPIAIVDVSDVTFSMENGISFKAVVDVAPDFKLPKYEKIPIEAKEVKVEEKDINDAYLRLQESSARYEEVAGRPVKADDFIRCDFAGTIDGRSFADFNKSAAIYGEAKDFTMVIGKTDIIPRFSDELIGAEIGKEKEFKVTFPKDFREQSLSGKEATYKIVVKDVRERILPELTEEFFKKFSVSNAEELRGKIKEDLLKVSEANEKERKKSEVIKYLLEKTEIDIPQSVVEQEKQAIIRDIVNRIAMQGATKEQITEQRDSIFDTAGKSAIEKVKISYILNKIAEEEQVIVSEEDTSKKIEMLSARYGMAPEKMRVELEKNNHIELLESEIRADKTLEILLGRAKIK